MMRSDVVGCHWVMQQSEANNRDDDDDDEERFDWTSIAAVAILKQTEAFEGQWHGGMASINTTLALGRRVGKMSTWA